MPCIRCPYQTNPNTKRKTKAAMNAMKNFFQFIIFSFEVAAKTPEDPGKFIAKWRPACRYKLQLSCSFDTTPRLPRRVCGRGFNVQPELAQQAYIEIYLRV